MSTDPDLNGRLRVALTSAAEAVDPPVGTLLAEATDRGRRRRSQRRAAVLAVVLAVAAVPFGIVGLARRSGPVEVAAAPSRADLIGTWQTPSVPAATWAATYRRAGGTDAAAAAFLGPPMDGPAATYRIVLRVTATEWSLFVSADGRDLEAGWHGAYQLDGSLIRVRAAGDFCEATYRVALAGPSLHIGVVADDCGATDDLAQRTIYQTAAFQRAA